MVAVTVTVPIAIAFVIKFQSVGRSVGWAVTDCLSFVVGWV